MKFFATVLLAYFAGMPRANAQHDVKVSSSFGGAFHLIERNNHEISEGHVGGNYEYVINEHMGVLISGTYIRSFESSDYPDIDYSGFRMMPEFRCYFRPGDHNARGFFAGAFLTYRNTRGSILSRVSSMDTLEFKQTTHNVGVGITAGFKFVANSGFIFEVAAGYGHHFMSSQQSLINSNPDYYGPTALPLNNFGYVFNIGWRFGDESRNKDNEDR